MNYRINIELTLTITNAKVSYFKYLLLVNKICELPSYGSGLIKLAKHQRGSDLIGLD
jgi:hypothetical protein